MEVYKGLFFCELQIDDSLKKINLNVPLLHGDMEINYCNIEFKFLTSNSDTIGKCKVQFESVQEIKNITYLKF